MPQAVVSRYCEGDEYYIISNAGGTARLANAVHVCEVEDNRFITLGVRNGFFSHIKAN